MAKWRRDPYLGGKGASHASGLAGVHRMPTAVTSVFRSDALGRLSPRALRRAMRALSGQARRLRDRFERRLVTLIES